MKRLWPVILGVALVAIVAYAFVTWTQTEGPRGASQSPSGGEVAEATRQEEPPWVSATVSERFRPLVAPHEANWKLYSKLEFLHLADRENLRSSLRRVAGRSRFIPTPAGDVAPDPNIRSRFGEEVCRVMDFLGSEADFASVETQLLNGRRYKREDLPAWLFDSYKHVFGHAGPFEGDPSAAAREIIADFYNKHRTSNHRGNLVRGVSVDPEDGFVAAFYWLDASSDSERVLVKMIEGDEDAAYWFGSLANEVFFLTEGNPSRAELIQREGRVLWAEAFVIVELANNDRLPINVTAYHDPQTGQWRVYSVYGQSSPLYASGIARIW